MDRRRTFCLLCLGFAVATANADQASPPPTTLPTIAAEAAPVTLPLTTVDPPVFDLEAHPLPRSTAATAIAPGTTKPKQAWWSGPEARVVGCLVLLIAGAILFTKYGPKSMRGAVLTGGSRPSGVVQVLSRFPIGRGRQLLLLECGPRILLLEETKSRTGGGLQTLSEFSSPEDVAALRSSIEAANRPSEASFRRDLERSLESYSRTGAPVAFGGGALPSADSIETVDLTRRRPRRSSRGLE